MAPNVAKNDFESVISRLDWNIANWPGRRLDRIIDNANYTCASSGNLVRAEGVSSTTYFRVECECLQFWNLCKVSLCARMTK